MIVQTDSTYSLRRSIVILALFPLLALLADFVIRFSYLKVLEPSLFIHFILSFIFDCTFYFVLLFLISLIPKKKLIALGTIVFLISAVQLLIYGHYFYFGVLPNPYSINYFINHSADSMSLISSSVRWFHVFVFVGIFTAQFYLLRNALSGLNTLSQRIKYSIVGIFLIVVVVFNNNVRFAPASYSITPATIFSIKYVLQERWFNSSFEIHKGYVRRRFEITEQSKIPMRYNVILFLSESVRKKDFSSYGYERTTTPFLDSLIASGSAIQFQHHVSNAVSTQYSVPMIFSGNFTIEKTDQPFVYDYIHRWTNAKTFFFTSQSMQRSNIDLVYNTSLDTFVCQEQLEYEQFNDLGVDDAVFALSVTPMLTHFNTGKYFSVVQFNNTHYPYTVKPHITDFFSPEHPNTIDHYDNTIREQDDIMRSYIRALQFSGALDSSIIFFTSDHGEAFGEHGHSGHLHSLYNEEIEVPMWILLPSSFPKEKRKMIEENALRNTSHLDIFPTMMELLGLNISDGIKQEFSGQSLLDPVLEDRIIPVVGKDMIDTKGIILGTMKFIETKNDGRIVLEAFEYRSDAKEQKNLWQTLSESKKNEVKDLLHKVDSISTAVNK
ncbi:MAG: sulfatase-like hydrolase/transferase [Bacteroidota bacterium]|nr:sulfatase-like hydrolase/transferase [Bacteroidota bacterium]